MANSAAFIPGDESGVEDVGGGIRRKILGYNKELMVVKAWFEEGSIGYVHSHPHSQVTYVESGVFEVTVGDEVKRLEAGDTFYVAPHLDHGAKCLEAGVLLDTFSPYRADFLE